MRQKCLKDRRQGYRSKEQTIGEHPKNKSEICIFFQKMYGLIPGYKNIEPFLQKLRKLLIEIMKESIGKERPEKDEFEIFARRRENIADPLTT